MLSDCFLLCELGLCVFRDTCNRAALAPCNHAETHIPTLPVFIWGIFEKITFQSLKCKTGIKSTRPKGHSQNGMKFISCSHFRVPKLNFKKQWGRVYKRRN